MRRRIPNGHAVAQVGAVRTTRALAIAAHTRTAAIGRPAATAGRATRDARRIIDRRNGSSRRRVDVVLRRGNASRTPDDPINGISLLETLARSMAAPEQILSPVDLQKDLKENDVYYPIRNRDFQQWRAKHHRGGDFVIYSSLKKIALPKPMEFLLDERCHTF